jgi:hypothetical protein
MNFCSRIEWFEKNLVTLCSAWKSKKEIELVMKRSSEDVTIIFQSIKLFPFFYESNSHSLIFFKKKWISNGNRDWQHFITFTFRDRKFSVTFPSRDRKLSISKIFFVHILRTHFDNILLKKANSIIKNSRFILKMAASMHWRPAHVLNTWFL